MQELSQQVVLASMLDLGTTRLRLQRCRYSQGMCFHLDSSISSTTTTTGTLPQEVSDQLHPLLFIRRRDVQDVMEPTLFEVLRHRSLRLDGCDGQGREDDRLNTYIHTTAT